MNGIMNFCDGIMKSIHNSKKIILPFIIPQNLWNYEWKYELFGIMNWFYNSIAKVHNSIHNGMEL